MLNQICIVTSRVPFPGSEIGSHMHVEAGTQILCNTVRAMVSSKTLQKLMATKLLATIQWRGRSLRRLPLAQMLILKLHKYDHLMKSPMSKTILLRELHHPVLQFNGASPVGKGELQLPPLEAHLLLHSQC